ncbi:ATP-binding protein [uncultured Erythrobacter sp.]|uniref:ATP-binding protein n=1 Tax=uncultured Erythrobacter sp. TaxID=263913 RepID=UPI002639FA00|nr:ATP-binding protein [uncultured Erythrobacter sp.]
MGHRRRFSAFVTKDSNPAPAIRHSLQFAREFIAQYDLEPRLQVKLAILVEELVSNSLRHGGRFQDLGLLLALQEIEGSVRLTIEDDGPPFDPISIPPITGPDPATGGGIGLAIVHAWGEDPAYVRSEDTNALELTLR